MRLITLAFALVTAFSANAWAAAHSSTLFDVASGVDKVTIPAKGETPKTTITCHHYAHYTIKEIDEGEVGAAQLSILATDGKQKPKCERANAATEKVVNPADWAGYFKGVKGDFIFVDAADGTNGGMGFAVFGTDAKKLFDDLATGEFHAIDVANGALTLKYQRAFAGPCSVVSDGAACWPKLATAAGVAATPAPDCAAGYLKAKTEMAKGRCEEDKKAGKTCIDKAMKELDAQRWNEAPSVITFEAQTVIADGKATTTASGPALACYPSD
jgi:hypothetical protein